MNKSDLQNIINRATSTDSPDLNRILATDLCGWGGPCGFLPWACDSVLGKTEGDQARALADEFQQFLEKYFNFLEEISDKIK